MFCQVIRDVCQSCFWPIPISLHRNTTYIRLNWLPKFGGLYEENALFLSYSKKSPSLPVLIIISLPLLVIEFKPDCMYMVMLLKGSESSVLKTSWSLLYQRPLSSTFAQMNLTAFNFSLFSLSGMRQNSFFSF